MQVVRMNDVWKYYALGETRVAALKGVSLDIEQGEFVAVWGPSGCGKSTLCNLIGLIDAPTSGSVEFMGQDSLSLADDAKSELRNRSIGFVFQSFNLLPVLSALENVMLPLQILGKPARESRQKAEEALVELDLAEHISHRPAKLSGGQQQRVAIARALITDPMLIIADEPTANLDSENARKIIDLMQKISIRRGTTFVFSTHDQRLLERVYRLIRLQDGSVLEDRVNPRNGEEHAHLD